MLSQSSYCDNIFFVLNRKKREQRREILIKNLLDILQGLLKQKISHLCSLVSLLKKKIHLSLNNRNNKKRQHQKAVATNIDDDVILEKMKKGITAFYPTLLRDDVWQNLYLENDTCLSADNLYLLLRHFQNTSLKSGTTYSNLFEVKKHFANWYQINHSKKALGQFLQEGKKAEQAQAALHQSMNDADYRTALEDYRKVIENGIARLEGKEPPHSFEETIENDPLGLR